MLELSNFCLSGVISPLNRDFSFFSFCNSWLQFVTCCLMSKLFTSLYV